MQVESVPPSTVGYSASSLSISSAITTTVPCDQIMGNSSTRDVTFKPTPIKAQRHVENPIMNYPQIPMYSFNSPKNPSGVSPFQPTGELCWCYFNIYSVIVVVVCRLRFS